MAKRINLFLRSMPGICKIPDSKAARAFVVFVAFGLALTAGGCLHPKVGPQSLSRDRADYSVSLSDSWKEQTLLNIVKVRYLDTPIFVDVGSIVSSYTLAQSASAGGTIATSPPSSGMLGGSVSFSTSPTITYTPLTGSAYIRTLTTPLPVAIVFSTIDSGAPADIILRASVKSINGLRSPQVGLNGITLPDPPFLRVLELLRDLQASGAVRFYIKEDANKQQTSILALRKTNVAPDVQAEIVELRALLHLNPDATELTIVSTATPANDTEIAIQTRSIIGLLQHMAAEVEVPSDDVARHHALPGFEAGRAISGVNPMIRIHSSKNKQEEAFVSVHYRDTWFWIDDGDLPSKRAFALLMQLFTMADTGAKENLPVVTIPAH
jgi:hypothetical protein